MVFSSKESFRSHDLSNNRKRLEVVTPLKVPDFKGCFHLKWPQDERLSPSFSLVLECGVAAPQATKTGYLTLPTTPFSYFTASYWPRRKKKRGLREPGQPCQPASTRATPPQARGLSCEESSLPALLPSLPRAPNASWRRRPGLWQVGAGHRGGVAPLAGDFTGRTEQDSAPPAVCKHYEAVGGAGSAVPAPPQGFCEKNVSGQDWGRHSGVFWQDYFTVTPQPVAGWS